MSNAEKGVEKYYTNQGFYLDLYLESLGKMTKISDKEDSVSKPQSNRRFFFLKLGEKCKQI